MLLFILKPARQVFFIQSGVFVYSIVRKKNFYLFIYLFIISLNYPFCKLIVISK